MQIIPYLVGVIALVLFARVSWQKKQATRLKAILAIITSASLSYALLPSLVVFVFIGADLFIVSVTWYMVKHHTYHKLLQFLWFGVLLAIFIAFKRQQTQTDNLLVSPTAWIGMSYLILRLVHLLVDGNRNRIGDATLAETLVYALHPATLVAGPIDRIQHSVSEQRQSPIKCDEFSGEGIWRIFLGLFKKFALANLFYGIVVAFPIQIGGDIRGAWLWLIAYSFYLYFDFAAYSDLAIGGGRILGISLPENFANPYAQSNLIRFWQCWHITLSTWLRDYIFSPLSRTLLRHLGAKYSTPIQFICHVSTMVICGLWHGLTFGFVVWGLWHGVGLFATSQWGNLRRRFNLPALPFAVGIPATFIFVSLGWIFFTHGLVNALAILKTLVGLG